MKVIGLSLLVCVVVGCATLSEEELGLVREFDEYANENEPDADDIEDIHWVWIFAGYVTLSDKERASMKNSQTVEDLKSFVGSDPDDHIKSLRGCLTTHDIWFIKRGGLGFDPKRLNGAVFEVDPQHFTTRQKVIHMKILQEVFRGFGCICPS